LRGPEAAQIGDPQKVEEFVRDFLLEPLHFLATAILPAAVAFPAERKALVSLYKLLDEAFARPEGGLVHAFPALLGSIPVSRFLVLLRVLDTNAPYLLDPSTSLYARLVTLLEEQILKGSLQFAGDFPMVHLGFTATGTQQALSMHASASLVRALAGLDLYLKYLANTGDFLVIDEPEMNAHPEAQIAITEFLALLVNAGLHMTVTTHSPYIVDHLNNLVEAAKLPETRQETMQAKFKLGTKDAFLDPDKLAVYYFGEDGHVHDAFNRETLSLDWSTFGKQSDYLNELYSELLQAGIGTR
jgi:hypothetical protein